MMTMNYLNLCIEVSILINDESVCIDNYEPYFEGIRGLHNDVYKALIEMDFVNKETGMHILQCNYKEYIGYGHDVNYKWFHMVIDNDKRKDFVIGFNIKRFKNREIEIDKIINIIKKTWLQKCSVHIDYLGNIPNVEYLHKDNYEMILSVHFWIDNKEFNDGINDTQYMKIVYTGKSINNEIRKIKELR